MPQSKPLNIYTLALKIKLGYFLHWSDCLLGSGISPHVWNEHPHMFKENVSSWGLQHPCPWRDLLWFWQQLAPTFSQGGEFSFSSCVRMACFNFVINCKARRTWNPLWPVSWYFNLNSSSYSSASGGATSRLLWKYVCSWPQERILYISSCRPFTFSSGRLSKPGQKNMGRREEPNRLPSVEGAGQGEAHMWEQEETWLLHKCPELLRIPTFKSCLALGLDFPPHFTKA